MPNAVSTYRLWITLSAAAAATTVLGVLVSVDALAFHITDQEAAPFAWSAEFLLGATAFVVGAVGMAAGVRAVHAVAAHVTAERRLARLTRSLPRRTVDGLETIVVTSKEPMAFCAGVRHPRVYVSSGAVDLLNPADLVAVVAHEHHHLRRRDPLRMACIAVLRRALFFVPGLTPIATGYGGLTELDADMAAEARVGRQPLAAALLTFAEAGGSLDAARVDRLTGRRVPRLVSTGAVAFATLGVLGVMALVGGIGVATGCFDLDVLSVLDQPGSLLTGIGPCAAGAMAILLAGRRAAPHPVRRR